MAKTNLLGYDGRNMKLVKERSLAMVYAAMDGDMNMPIRRISEITGLGQTCVCQRRNDIRKGWKPEGVK